MFSFPARWRFLKILIKEKNWWCHLVSENAKIVNCPNNKKKKKKKKKNNSDQFMTCDSRR